MVILVAVWPRLNVGMLLFIRPLAAASISTGFNSEKVIYVKIGLCFGKNLAK